MRTIGECFTGFTILSLITTWRPVTKEEVYLKKVRATSLSQ
jgi:hypothetical protein